MKKKAAKKLVSIRLPLDVIDKLNKQARKEHRTITNKVEQLVINGLK